MTETHEIRRKPFKGATHKDQQHPTIELINYPAYKEVLFDDNVEVHRWHNDYLIQVDLIMHEHTDLDSDYKDLPPTYFEEGNMIIDYTYYLDGVEQDGGRASGTFDSVYNELSLQCNKKHKEFRTQKQFDQICDSLINGNFKQAVKEVIRWGFYAVDLKNFIENTEWINTCEYITRTDFLELIERASEIRTEKECL